MDTKAFYDGATSTVYPTARLLPDGGWDRT